MAVAGYKLRVNGGPLVDSIIDVGNVLTYDITGLDPDTLYSVEVAAYDAAGNLSAYSPAVTETTDPVPLILDAISVGAYAAYSFRKLRAAYAGPCAKVSLVADGSSPTDIGFDVNGWFDEAAAAAVGSPLYIYFYDQSGNARHQTVVPATTLPLVDYNTINTKPSADCPGAGGILGLGDMSSLTAGEAFILIKRDADPPTDGSFWVIGSDTGNTSFVPYQGDNLIYDAFGTTARKTTVDPTPAFTSWRLYSVYSAANDWANYLDGAQLYSTATNTVGFTSSAYFAAIDLHLADFLIFGQKLSGADRTIIFNDIESTYGLTFP